MAGWRAGGPGGLTCPPAAGSAGYTTPADAAAVPCRRGAGCRNRDAPGWHCCKFWHPPIPCRHSAGSPRQGQSEQELHRHTTGHSSVEDSDPALIAAAPPHDYELQRGEEGFGMDIGPTATVVFFSGPNSVAKRAGVPIGGRITKVDSVAVGTKDDVLAQLAAASATVVFTVAAAKPAEPPGTPPVRQLSDASRHAAAAALGEAAAEEARAAALAAEEAAIGDNLVAEHDS